MNTKCSSKQEEQNKTGVILQIKVSCLFLSFSFLLLVFCVVKQTPHSSLSVTLKDRVNFTLYTMIRVKDKAKKDKEKVRIGIAGQNVEAPSGGRRQTPGEIRIQSGICRQQ
jgi:hypothetical protein